MRIMQLLQITALIIASSCVCSISLMAEGNALDGRHAQYHPGADG